VKTDVLTDITGFHIKLRKNVILTELVYSNLKENFTQLHRGFRGLPKLGKLKSNEKQFSH
jgi:hypothetical protein